MDEKVRKKKSNIEESSLGTSLEPNKRKKEKHKEKKKMHGTDKTFNENEAVGGNCIYEAGNRQAFSIDGKFMTDREEGDISKKKKNKGRKDNEVVNSNIADDKVAEFLNDNHKSKVKKRKNCDDSLSGMQEMGTSKPSKKGKGKLTRDSYFEDCEVDPPIDEVSAGNATADSLVNKVDCPDMADERGRGHRKTCGPPHFGYTSRRVEIPELTPRDSMPSSEEDSDWQPEPQSSSDHEPVSPQDMRGSNDGPINVGSGAYTTRSGFSNDAEVRDRVFQMNLELQTQVQQL